MFTCPLCTKKFKTSQELNYHTVSHTKEKPHQCPKCSAAFGRISSVHQHVRMVHDGIKKVYNRTCHCHMCSYKCYNKTMLHDHLRKHFAEQPFSCPILGCQFKTKYRTSLLSHARTAHNDEKPIECPSDGCSYRTKTRQLLKSHLKAHSNEKPFACEFAGCSYTCKVKGSLKDHAFSAHRDEKPFVCLTCGFRSKSRSNLMQHQFVHTRNKRFPCKVLNCSFTSHLKRSVQLHFDTKHRSKDVLCTEPGCNFKFGSIALLKRHLKTHGSHSFKCPLGSCKFSTKYKTSLLPHISRCRKKLQSATVLGPRKLDVESDGTNHAVTLNCRFLKCSYRTKFPRHYDRHTITHKKEEKRQLVCSFCLARFSHLYQLKDHIQRHIGEKPYSCSHCKYTAVGSTELSSHATKSHQIRVIPRHREDEMRKCHTCRKNCLSYNEFVLHSMSHLQPFLVLERLHVHVV